MQFALGASFAREASTQALSLALRSRGQPHPPFRFRMFFSDFLQYFKYAISAGLVFDLIYRNVIVMHKSDGFPFRSMLNGTVVCIVCCLPHSGVCCALPDFVARSFGTFTLT